MMPGKTPHGAFNKIMDATKIEIENGVEFEKNAQIIALIPDSS